MERELYAWKQIGIIRTRFTSQEGTPIQASMAGEETGTIEILPEYADGLLDIEGFSHLHLIYAFHGIGAGALRVKPYLDTVEHGIFATRAPKRPNPIGLSVVRLVAVRGNILEIAGVDMLDGTPLLDIKPYIPSLDVRDADRIGWYADRLLPGVAVLADDRFAKK
ncbi:MAG TPA: tRNA (N6-threonylcarbamoyladenosine(37)-N6)-methyltransferase TrmO [Candidatus Ozemobacteraceae bacterium]|nr:tRNA (N6-threonylcarbamoyladenosine(37)-N6)-methyltransferase TrmO [Candidatus Ozemobacteraceae bacterium]